MSISDEIFVDLEEDPNLQIAVRAAYVTKNRDGVDCLLLGLHRDNNKYMFPGGRIDPNDNATGVWGYERVLGRELEEELGIKLRQIQDPMVPLSQEACNRVLRIPWSSKSGPRLDYVLIFDIEDGQSFFTDGFELPRESELAHLKWFPHNAPPQNIFPNAAKAFYRAPMIAWKDRNKHLLEF